MTHSFTPVAWLPIGPRRLGREWASWLWVHFKGKTMNELQEDSISDQANLMMAITGMPMGRAVPCQIIRMRVLLRPLGQILTRGCGRRKVEKTGGKAQAGILPPPPGLVK